MEPQRWARVSAHLDPLLDLPAEAREQALQRIAGEDPLLAAELRRLLELDQAHGDFLAAPLPVARPEPVAAPPRPGDRIGPYQLVRLLGEGGMGTVWLAAREDGLYQREVALKLLRADVAASGLRARFARERQILAQLSHPNIARLFDAGVDAGGRPYLALEYVEGRNLLEHARERGLDVTRRIGLMLQVCDAVAYAHGRLVVHRDLKPSNIMVRGDGRVLLLDFGIAKLLDPDATSGATELTRIGGRAYTPHYAAPEQVRGEAVSTQTDVYALGVVLFELLTGQRPYRLRRNSTAELEEAILQQEPQRASYAARRGDDTTITSEPLTGSRTARQRARALSGDLDNILLKALRKSPDQRYASVEAFAADLRRHLAGHPVSARPDRFAYRASKFVQRHALGLSLAGAVLLLLVATAALLRWQAREALEAAQRAQAMQAFMLGLFERTDPNQAQPTDLSVAELLRDGASRARSDLELQPAVQQELLLTIAGLQNGFGRFAEALQLIEGIAAPGAERLQLRLANERARALRGLERNDECLATLDAARHAAQAQRGEEPLVAAQWHTLRGRCLRAHQQTGAAREEMLQALQLREANAAPDMVVVETLAELAALDADDSANDLAIARMRRALARLEAGPGSNNLMGVNLWRSLGALHRAKGDPDAAEAAYVRALSIGDTLFPHGHPSLAETRRQLAASHVDHGRLDQAEPLLEQVLDYQRATLGERHPDVGRTLNGQAVLAWKRGDDARAVALLEQAIAIWRESGQRERLAGGLHNLAMVLADGGEYGQARPRVREALQLREQLYGREHIPVAMSLRLLAEIEIALGRPAEAAPLLERSLRIEQARHGEQHPQTALVRATMAQLAYARGDVADGDAKVAALLAQIRPTDAERRRVRNAAELLQAAARCRSGAPGAGRPQLQRVAVAASENRGALRSLLRDARQACGP